MAKGYNSLDKGITEREFMKEACRWADSKDIQTAQKWWSAFQEVIIREMFYNGYCRLPGICAIDTKFIPAGRQKQIDSDGVEHIYMVPERRIPVFEAHDDFINDINMSGVTKLYRVREKNEKLSRRDLEREIRIEIAELKENGELTAIKEKEKQLMEQKKKFKPKSKTKKKTNKRSTRKNADSEE